MIKFTPPPATRTSIQRDTDNKNPTYRVLLPRSAVQRKQKPDLQGPPSKKRSSDTTKTQPTRSSFQEAQFTENKNLTYRVFLPRRAVHRKQNPDLQGSSSTERSSEIICTSLSGKYQSSISYHINHQQNKNVPSFHCCRFIHKCWSASRN